LSEIETHTIDPSAASPGAILKRCREYHEISLNEAEEATKIGANYLQALEEDQISQFASMAYLKGFLRIYATYLGLSPDDMIRLYDKLYISGTRQSDGKKAATGVGNKAPRRKFPLQKLAIPAVLLVLILITSAIINRSPSTPLRQNQPAPAAASLTAPAVQPLRSSVKAALPAKKTEDAIADHQHIEASSTAQNKIPTPAPESTKGFIIRMKVTQSGTLTVTIDDSGS
jgi:cytoskeletal protein RodZ